jgi:hypothetical protein
VDPATHELPVGLIVFLCAIGVLLTAIACAPNAFVGWLFEYIRKKQNRGQAPPGP